MINPPGLAYRVNKDLLPEEKSGENLDDGLISS
jgi:hypothetical protein